MTIYKENTQCVSLNKGTTIFTEVYKGSQLLYSSGPDLSIPIYEYTNSNNNTLYLIGSKSIQGCLSDYIRNIDIYRIIGTLGSSGSQVSNPSGRIFADYIETINYNGINLYVYSFSDGSKYLIHQDCIEGSKTLSSGAILGQIHPTSYDINTDSFVFYGTYTYKRLYAKYYPTGVKILWE